MKVETRQWTATGLSPEYIKLQDPTTVHTRRKLGMEGRKRGVRHKEVKRRFMKGSGM